MSCNGTQSQKYPESTSSCDVTCPGSHPPCSQLHPHLRNTSYREPDMFLYFRKPLLNWKLTFPGLNVFTYVGRSAHRVGWRSGGEVRECCFIRRNVPPLEGDQAQCEVCGSESGCHESQPWLEKKEEEACYRALRLSVKLSLCYYRYF